MEGDWAEQVNPTAMQALEYLSAREHKKVLEAHAKYGPVLENADGLVRLLWKMAEGGTLDGQVFFMLLSQVQQSLTCALLSAIRKHEVSTHLSLRYALESGVLAAYSLTMTDVSAFGIMDEDGMASPRRAALGSAYSWIDREFPVHSQKIKAFKDQINTYYSHGSLFPSGTSVTFREEAVEAEFFDNIGDEMTTLRLLWVGNVAFGLIDLVLSVQPRGQPVRFREGLRQELQRLGVENGRIMSELKQSPRFAKFARHGEPS